jgi:hypothetical protein
LVSFAVWKGLGPPFPGLAKAARPFGSAQGRLWGTPSSATPVSSPDTPAVPHRFWQARYYDFKVWTEQKRIEKLRYIHRNLVTRGLVASPEQWRWSSFRRYWCGEAGPVRINDTEILVMTVRPRTA